MNIQTSPLSIQRRNERERSRVRAVNAAFIKLRQMVPTISSRNKRVSKVKTLQKALEYICELHNILEVSSQASEKW